MHTIIDKLNRNLRSIDEYNGQRRVREFFAISPEDAYAIFEAMADINDCRHKLKNTIQHLNTVQKNWLKKLQLKLNAERRTVVQIIPLIIGIYRLVQNLCIVMMKKFDVR